MILVWKRQLRGRERKYVARLRRAGELMKTLWAAVAKAKEAR